MSRLLRRREALLLLLGVTVLVAACASSTDAGSAPEPPAGTSRIASPIARSSAATPEPPQASMTPLPAGPTLPRVPILEAPAYASRVVVADLGIDLPVISGDLQPPPNYPYCDVAAYVTRFSQPYESGVTYLSAHAQEGMFQPLLEASKRNDGEELLGMRVDVYTDNGMRYGYRIERVERHAEDYAILNELPLDERRLILQTSEGPYGTTAKLQVVAVPVDEASVDVAEAIPEAEPRDCRPPELRDDDA